MRHGPARRGHGIRRAGREGRAIRHKHADCHRLHRLVRHTVRDLRTGLRDHDSATAGHGGLALSNLLGFDESKFKITTGISGAIGTLLAAFGLLNAFQGFLSLMSALIPPLAGVIIAAYWIVGKGKKENFHFSKGVSAAGLISFIVGALVACITGGTFTSFPGLVEAMPFLNWPFFVGPVNGIVVSLVLYVILAGVSPKKAN